MKTIDVICDSKHLLQSTGQRRLQKNGSGDSVLNIAIIQIESSFSCKFLCFQSVLRSFVLIETALSKWLQIKCGLETFIKIDFHKICVLHIKQNYCTIRARYSNRRNILVSPTLFRPSFCEHMQFSTIALHFLFGLITLQASENH